jgi:hypothetical protein
MDVAEGGAPLSATAPAPTLEPPIAAETTLLAAMLLGHARLDDVAALRPEHFTARSNGKLFAALRERLTMLPDEDLNCRYQAIIAAVPEASGEFGAAAVNLGRFKGIGPTLVARILDTWLRRRLRDVAKLTAEEIQHLAEQQLAVLRAAMP